MEIRVLRYFLAITREESITGAANSLHITQPTLSRQIKDLEEELGQKLFVRGSHRITLTAEGMLLRKRAEEIIAMVDKTQQEFYSMKGNLSGDIYIGGGETEAMNYIASVCHEIQIDYPDIRYHLYSGNAEDVTERLDKGLLDFGLLIQPTDITKYNYLNIPAKDRWGVLMLKTCPLAKKEEIKATDLIGLPLIFSRQVLQSRMETNDLAKWFGKDWKDLNIVTTFNLVYNATIMAKQGIGYVITLDNLADTSDDSPLCFRPLSPKIESGLDIVWKKYQVFSPAAKLFLNKLKEKFSNL
ncbi:LysR family transcriptional regulator [Megamonas hypermegale]|uniref:LysR family transcriptional regulator n=1 Tax=Megamonas hypermegale TaxID=158847 RepID=UPI00195663CD|nr:LysR family transcriptional regulator [Megamonas hypermegale]MBM6832448.1 LysR family transcriptional regulator [Megamonas hypermegale]